MQEADEGRAELAVKAVSSGEADLLMKGNVKTATLLKAVLNKEWGLRSGSLLSHVFLFQIPRMGRAFCLTDGGMSMYPDLEAKKAIIENAVECYHKLGVECPRVAALAAVETVNQDMPCTVDAAVLTQITGRGQIRGCLVDGPLALDNAVSEEPRGTRHRVEVAGGPTSSWSPTSRPATSWARSCSTCRAVGEPASSSAPVSHRDDQPFRQCRDQAAIHRLGAVLSKA